MISSPPQWSKSRRLTLCWHVQAEARCAGHVSQLAYRWYRLCNVFVLTLLKQEMYRRYWSAEQCGVKLNELTDAAGYVTSLPKKAQRGGNEIFKDKLQTTVKRWHFHILVQWFLDLSILDVMEMYQLWKHYSLSYQQRPYQEVIVSALNMLHFYKFWCQQDAYCLTYWGKIVNVHSSWICHRDLSISVFVNRILTLHLPLSLVIQRGIMWCRKISGASEIKHGIAPQRQEPHSYSWGWGPWPQRATW